MIKEKSDLFLILFSGFLSLIIFILLIWGYPIINQKYTDYKIEQHNVKQGYTYDPSSSIILSGDSINFSYSNTGSLPQNILEQFKEKGEFVSNDFIPQHPKYDNILYLSTRGGFDGYKYEYISDNFIYIYDSSEGSINVIYSDKKERMLKIVGRKDNEIILYYDYVSSSPGPCYRKWSDAKRFGSINLSKKPYVIKPYKISENLIFKSEYESEKCRQELGL